MLIDRAHHWNEIYRSRDREELTWFQAEPVVSLQLIAAATDPGASVVDIGAGRSTLAQHLLDRGHDDITLVDVSDAALTAMAEELGGRVATICADVTAWTPQRTWDLWHDRAVVHFLTIAADRDAYVAALRRALRPGGHAVISTFALDGPERCSGLPVVRYGPDELLELVGPDDFELLVHRLELHRTPRGGTQRFHAVLLRRR